MDDRYTQILAQLKRRFDRAEHVNEVQEYLSSKGFDAGQIGTIVSAWLSDIVRNRLEVAASADWPVRVQGPQERGRFATEAWGYLMGCRASGVLGALDLEQVIERLLGHVEGQIGLEDARAIVDHGYSDGFGSQGGPTVVH
jgi:Smg protein